MIVINLIRRHSFNIFLRFSRIISPRFVTNLKFFGLVGRSHFQRHKTAGGGGMYFSNGKFNGQRVRDRVKSPELAWKRLKYALASELPRVSVPLLESMFEPRPCRKLGKSKGWDGVGTGFVWGSFASGWDVTAPSVWRAFRKNSLAGIRHICRVARVLCLEFYAGTVLV